MLHEKIQYSYNFTFKIQKKLRASSINQLFYCKIASTPNIFFLFIMKYNVPNPFQTVSEDFKQSHL